MKKTILPLAMIVSTIAFSQVKRLNDPSIVAQEKRQVFERWGDWRPYPKYVLGIQTNFAYATVWGWLSPQRNRNYKNGADIRPLRVGGEETQRLALAEAERAKAEIIAKETDTLQKRAIQEFAHITSVTASADVLWLLYYKSALKPLENFPAEPANYLQWRLPNAKTYDMLKGLGMIDDLQSELNLLKEKYDQSRTVDMPRGKRFIMYTETLLGWRRFITKIKRYHDKGTLALRYKSVLDLFKSKSYNPTIYRDDREIVGKIMEKYKNRF